MRVVISQPMNGISDDEVLATRMDIVRKFKEANIEVIDTFFTGNKMDAQEYTNPALYYLGLSIDSIGRADAVYFVPGWDKARGCIIEREICKAYEIQILDEIPEPVIEENIESSEETNDVQNV